MNTIDKFIEITDNPLLENREVAKEVVFMLRSYKRILPFHITYITQAIGWQDDFEAMQSLASILMSDGWLTFSAEPYTGKGMSAVNAYEPTEKARKLFE